MQLEYFIEELTPFGKITHKSTFSAAEAGRAAVRLSNRTKNPVIVSAHIIPVNQIEAIEEMIDETIDNPISIQELFEEIYGKEEKIDELDSDMQLFLNILTETANKVLADYKFGILTADGEHSEDEN